jgi:hypothetical protein
MWCKRLRFLAFWPFFWRGVCRAALCEWSSDTPPQDPKNEAEFWRLSLDVAAIANAKGSDQIANYTKAEPFRAKARYLLGFARFLLRKPLAFQVKQVQTLAMALTTEETGPDACTEGPPDSTVEGAVLTMFWPEVWLSGSPVVEEMYSDDLSNHHFSTEGWVCKCIESHRGLPAPVFEEAEYADPHLEVQNEIKRRAHYKIKDNAYAMVE